VVFAKSDLAKKPASDICKLESLAGLGTTHWCDRPRHGKHSTERPALRCLRRLALCHTWPDVLPAPWMAIDLSPE